MQPSVGAYFTLYVRNEEGFLRRVAGLRSAGIGPRLGALDAANPDGYDWAYSVPGQLSWQGSADGLRLYGNNALQRTRAYRLLEDAVWGRKHVPVVAQYPNGSTREGTAIVTALPDQVPFNDVISGSVKLKGVGRLVRARGLRFWGTGDSYGAGTWQDLSAYQHDATNATSGQRPATENGAFPALLFDGQDDTLQLDEGVFRGKEYGFTFAGVARFDSDQNHTVLGGAAEGTQTGPSEIDLDTQDNVTRLSLRVGNAPPLLSPLNSITVGEWFVFVCTYRPDVGRRLLVNGRVTEDDTGEIGRAPGTYFVGSEGRMNYLNGAIADLRIWGGPLSATLERFTYNQLRETYLNA